jgi:hypothetical protein
MDVKDRGRVPAELVVKFKDATGKWFLSGTKSHDGRRIGHGYRKGSRG